MLETLTAYAANPITWACLFGALYVLSHVVAWTPTLADDKALGIVTRVLNLIAANYGAAANGKSMAERVTDKLPPAGKVMGSLAVLVLSGSLMLPGCASLNRDDALAAGEATYAIARQASEMYATLPDHKPEVAAAAAGAVKTLRSALDAARIAQEAGDDRAYPIALAAVSTAATEAMVYVYTYRVTITDR